MFKKSVLLFALTSVFTASSFANSGFPVTLNYPMKLSVRCQEPGADYGFVASALQTEGTAGTLTLVEENISGYPASPAQVFNVLISHDQDGSVDFTGVDVSLHVVFGSPERMPVNNGLLNLHGQSMQMNCHLLMM